MTILTASGVPYVKRTTQTAPNLDPEFWLMSSGNSKDVLAKPYALHVWTNVCVRAIYRNVASLVKQLQTKKDGTIIKEHAVLKLLNKPNQLMDSVSFLQMVVSLLLLPATRGGKQSGGQCFIIPWNGARDDKVRLDKGEIPTELFPYPENYFEPWMEKHSNGRSTLRGWKFSINGVAGSEILFESGEIIRINMLNPYDILKGMSPFSPIASAVEFDAFADKYNSNIFENSGRLDGQVSSDQYIDPNELQNVKAEWYKQYTGENRHRVAFLSGGLKYEQFALSSSDLGYVDQEKWSRQKVLGAYGLNRIGAGDYEDINFATIREGRKMLWYDTYIPIDGMVLSAFNGQWVGNIDQGKYQLVSDYTTVPALQADMQERAKTGGILVTQMGYPPSLASRIVQLPLSQDDIAKWPHLDQQIQQSAPAFQQDVPTKMVAKQVQRDYSGEYIERVLDPGEKFFKRSLDRFFIDQRNGILDRVDAWMRQHTKAVKQSPTVNAWEFITEQTRQNLELMKIYKPAVKNQITLEKQQVESELGRGIQWDAGDTRVQYWMNKRSVYLEDINTNTFAKAGDAIDATIRQGIEDGLTVPELGREIKKAVQQVYEVRLGRPIEPNGLFDLGGMSSSQTIARTEMGSIASMSRADIFREEGIEKIEWVTSHDDKVRESHAALDGVTVRYGEEFPGVGLRYPRDAEGEAGEVINCVLPDTLVSGAFDGALKTFYSGNAIEIVTRNGYRLRSTINHPIAAMSGFVKAGSLNKGDHVVCHCGDDRTAFAISNNDIQYGESRIDDIYDAILSHGTSRVHCPTALDLDGDGKSLRGNIDAVKWFTALSNRGAAFDFELMLKNKPSVEEFFNKVFFESSNRTDIPSFPSGSNSCNIDRSCISHFSTGNPRALHLTDNSVGVISETLPFNCLRIGLASQLDISRYEYSVDSPAGYGKFLGKLINRFSGQVFFDEIVSVRVFPFDGHVYDLQSKVGYFNSNNIISRNCRCAFIAVTE